MEDECSTLIDDNRIGRMYPYLGTRVRRPHGEAHTSCRRSIDRRSKKKFQVWLVQEVYRVSYTDKTLVCSDCSESFVFTAGEQEFHASKGFTREPRRCPNCRRLKKQQNGEGGGSFGAPRVPRQMYDAVCASCGKEAKGPFEPRGDRPVYCSDCFQPQPRSLSSGGTGGGRPGGGFGGGGGGSRPVPNEPPAGYDDEEPF